MALPRILVLALGGTIAMTPGAGGGAVPAVDGAALVRAVPQLEEIAQIEARTLALVPSVEIDFARIEAVCAEICAARAAGFAGVVVTQGTDTIEETAFALGCRLPAGAPVVITGAMRHAGQAGADGPANLLAAVRVAADPCAAACGVVVVLDDTIHGAREVVKRHTTRCSAFESPGAGPLGAIVEGRVRLLRRAAPLPHLDPGAAGRKDVEVALLSTGVGDTGRMAQAAAAAGFDGFVLAGAGGGHCPAAVAQIWGDIAAQRPVVLSRRTGAGPVLTRTYGYPGSEIDLLERGLIHGGDLDPLKARVLLTLLLACGAQKAAIAAAFAQAGDAAAPV